MQQILANSENAGALEANSLLQAQFDILLKDKVWQKIIHWELGESKKVLRKIADKREDTGERLLSLIDPYFENTDTNIRATLALLIGGIYYLSLHSKSNGSTVCGIDINEEKGKLAVEKTIKNIIYDAFEKVGAK